MERINIQVYTRNELIEIVADEQKKVDSLGNANRTPFGDFCYEGGKKHISKLQGLLSHYPQDEVFYLHAGKPVTITEK